MDLNMGKIREVELERKDLEVAEMVLNELALSVQELEHLPKSLLFRLQGWMWAQRPERKVIGTAWTRVPKTWWDHAKMAVVAKVPGLSRWIDWEWQEVRREIEVDLQVAYPELRLLAPGAGRHLVVRQSVKGEEVKDGEFYWRWKDDWEKTENLPEKITPEEFLEILRKGYDDMKARAGEIQPSVIIDSKERTERWKKKLSS